MKWFLWILADSFIVVVTLHRFEPLWVSHLHSLKVGVRNKFQRQLIRTWCETRYYYDESAGSPESFDGIGCSVFFILIKFKRSCATEGLELCEGAGARFDEVRFGMVPRSFSRHEEISVRFEKRKNEINLQRCKYYLKNYLVESFKSIWRMSNASRTNRPWFLANGKKQIFPSPKST